MDYKHDTDQQIIERAELVWKNREQRQEEQLVERVFDATKSGMRGVLGIDSTLSALVEEKVRTLVIADGLAINGSGALAATISLPRSLKVVRSAAQRPS